MKTLSIPLIFFILFTNVPAKNPLLQYLPFGKSIIIQGMNKNWDYKEKLDSLVANNYSKDEYTYNNIGNVTLSINYEWLSGEWDSFYKDHYTYNINNNLTLFIDLMWDGEKWNNYLKKEYTYDNINNVTMVIWYAYYFSKQWHNYKKYEFTYNNNISILMDYSWGSGQWDTISKNEYTYNNNNKTANIITYNLNDSIWKKSIKYEYIYNNGGNTVLFTKYNWKQEAWANGDKFEYTYDNNSNMISYIWYQWKSTQWVNYYKYDAVYDLSANFSDIAFPYENLSYEIAPYIYTWYGSYTNKIDSVKFYSWDAAASTWKTMFSGKYYYSPFIVPIISDQPSFGKNRICPLSIKSNQTGSLLYFTNHSGSDIAVSIYSISGKIAKRVVIPRAGKVLDVSSFASGVYFVKFTDSSISSTATSFFRR